MSDTWVISDTHFNDEPLLGFFDASGSLIRYFDSVKQMNEAMLDNWADTVKVDDIVYHLGDVVCGENQSEWLAANFAKLPGKKRLVIGNRDNPKTLLPYFEHIMMWEVNFPKLLLSHTSQHPDTIAQKSRFSKQSILNIHGHIHSNPSPEGPYRCVCVEHTDYTPINIDELMKHLD